MQKRYRGSWAEVVIKFKIFLKISWNKCSNKPRRSSVYDATYCYRCCTSVVCVSVCVCGTRMCCEKTAKPIQMPFGEQTFMGPRNHIFKVEIPAGKGQFWGLPGPLKSSGSLCRGVRCKRDHSISITVRYHMRWGLLSKFYDHLL